jgi:Kef-type K+ transport system membrane component KefB
MSPPLVLGLLLICGLAAGQLAARFDLPRVAAYVVTGVLFSPGLLGGWLGININAWAEPLTSSALGIVAYLIGGSITMGQLRRMGGTILGSAIGESVGAVLVVFAAMWWLAPEVAGISRLNLALVFAAIAATTAPAGTVAILHQYHAKGPLSTALLGVVALDDAFGIIVFSLMLVVVAGDVLWLGTLMAVVKLGGSLLLGIAGGWALARLGRGIRRRNLVLPMLLGIILMVTGLSESLGLSPLLAAMTLGFVARFASGAGGARLSEPVEYLEEAVFIVFFTLAGAHFETALFFQFSALAGLYLIARVIGKVLGAAVGARVVGAAPSVVRWLGLGLVPQAGVAVGLALSLSHHPEFQQAGPSILTAVLATTLVYEIVGPFAARFALARAGELGTRRERRSG